MKAKQVKFRELDDFVHRDAFLLNCPTYESYLDEFSTNSDKYFLPNVSCCRQLVKLGYRSNGLIYTLEEYKKKKAIVEILVFGRNNRIYKQLSEGRVFKDPVLQQLALREKLNIEKDISTIIHMRDPKSKFSIYGYIDYEDSLHRYHVAASGASNWSEIFAEVSLLRPKTTDLSYYNTHTRAVYYNNTNNYNVIHSRVDGLTFMHRGDHKKISINSLKNSTREMYYSEIYGFVVFYDHIVRRKI